MADGATDDAVGGDLDGERRCGEQAVAGAEPVADDAVDDEGAVHFAGRGEALAAGQVAPLLRRDDAGGLEPLVVGIHVGDDVGSGGGGGANAGGAADAIENLLAEPVDEVEVGAHALAHDLRRDVDHVGVAHVAAIDDVGHLHAGVELVGLHLDGEDGDLRGFHVGEDGGGHIGERARGQIFEDEGVPGAAALGQLRGERGGDGLGGAVGDERDLFARIDAQAGGDGRARAGNEFGGVVEREQMRGGFDHAARNAGSVKRNPAVLRVYLLRLKQNPAE